MESQKRPRAAAWSHRPGLRHLRFVLAVSIACFLYGWILLVIEPSAFPWWIREDGPVEYLSFFILAGASLWAFAVSRAFRRQGDSRLRANVWLGLALLCSFAALEEISYGQRLFGIPTPEFLIPHHGSEPDVLFNRQSETNLHNLVVYGINVNKLIFGKILGLVTLLYFLIVSPLYGRFHTLTRIADRCALPLARGYQMLTIATVGLVSWRMTPTIGKVAELRELVSCAVLLAMLIDPRSPVLPEGMRARDGSQPRLFGSWNRFGPRLRVFLVVLALQLGLGTLFRLIYFTMFRSSAGALQTPEVVDAFYLGFKFDLRLALLICLPFVVLSLFAWLDPARTRAARPVWIAYFVTVQALVVLLYFVDLGHYDYLHARLDAGLIDHVLSTGIALGMAFQTYPVVRGLLVILLFALGVGFVLRKVLSAEPHPTDARTTRARRVLVGALLTSLYLFGIYGKWSWYPLRWSDAYASPKSFVAALGVNPILYLYDTIPNREREYDLDRVRVAHASIAPLLGAVNEPADPLSLRRDVASTWTPPVRPNLVLIHLEAFAGFKAGVLGNPLDSSPEFDRVASDSMLFTRFFVPTSPTARSVFTMLTGIPDVNPVRSASRNPRVIDQHTLVNALAGYETFYFLGGSATWANIRGLLAHNIPGITMFEEGDYDSPRVNVWGVSDLALFEKADEILSQQSAPSFAFIQTAGNHGPYTIPDRRGDFRLAAIGEREAREAGFVSVDAYNSFRFLDYSLGRFFELARRSPYYERTVFIMYGDHGAPSPRATAWEQLGLTHHHVPLVIHVPWLDSRARVDDSVASLVDVLPTALGLMGVSYTNTTLGRDLLAPVSAERRFAYINHGLLTDDYLLKVDPLGSSHLYAYDSEAALIDIGPARPEDTARMRKLYDDLLDTARYLLYHNPPLEDSASADGSR